MATQEEEEVAMKKLVVSALAYYGLKVFHIFDGREFKPCLKLIEGDRDTALKDFTELVNDSRFELLGKFAREFCRPDSSSSTPAAQPTEVQSQLVPEPVLRLVAPLMAEHGNMKSRTLCSGIWAALSTFVKDNSGHYVAPYFDGLAGNSEAKVNYGIQLQAKSKVEDAKTGTGDLVQNMNVYCPFSPTYSPTIDYPSPHDQADGRQESLLRKRDSAHHDEKPPEWRENLAKEWPHIFHEIQEHGNTETEEMETKERSSFPNPPSDLPALIQVEMVHLNRMQESPLPERKRKRERATDERESGGSLLYDSSLKSLGRENDDKHHIEILEVDSTICGKDEEKNMKSQIGSSHLSLDADFQDTGHKRNKTSWPAPLYGDQTRAKSSLPNFELPEEGDICTHELQGQALDTCTACGKKEDITYSKYTRLFKDDLTWKQKFLDGESLTCDICSSKGKVTTFTDVTLLLSHARRGFDMRGPEHRGYAKAIYNLIQLSEPGKCHSAVGRTTPVRKKRVWPPVIVLENTFKANDLDSDFKDLDEVSRRLKAFVNIDIHTLRKVMVHGKFEGTVLVEFPRTRRGLNDANRLHQYFLLTGRSLQDWDQLKDKSLALMRDATGVQEVSDLVKTGERDEIRYRIYFGYLATAKIMTRLDTFKKLVKWRFKEPKFIDDEY